MVLFVMRWKSSEPWVVRWYLSNHCRLFLWVNWLLLLCSRSLWLHQMAVDILCVLKCRRDDWRRMWGDDGGHLFWYQAGGCLFITRAIANYFMEGLNTEMSWLMCCLIWIGYIFVSYYRMWDSSLVIEFLLEILIVVFEIDVWM